MIPLHCVMTSAENYAGPARARVLVVDDDPGILTAVARLLKHESFETVFATHADEALRLMLACGTFSVVVADNHMPVMDGISFLSRVREISPATARILLTGQADMGLALKAINQGEVFRFLTKPWQTDELLLALYQGIQRYEKERWGSVLEGEIVSCTVEEYRLAS